MTQGSQVINKLLVNCSTNVDFLLLSPIFKRDQGIYGCQVSFSKNAPVSASFATIKIKLSSMKLANYSLEGEVQVEVLTGFKLVNSKPIFLSKNHNKDHFVVNTPTELSIKSPKNTNLQIQSTFNDKKNEQRVNLTAKGEEQFKQILTISNEKTGQTQEVTVEYKLQSSWFSFLYNFGLIDFLIFLFLFLIAIYLAVICTYQKQPSSFRQYPNETANFTNQTGNYGNYQYGGNIYTQDQSRINDSFLNRREPYMS